MKRYIENFFNDKYRSLFYRFSATLILIVVLVALGITIFNSAYNHLQQKSKLEDLRTQAKTLFENYYNNLFLDMDNKSVDLSNNKNLLKFLNDTESDSKLSLIDAINSTGSFCCMVSIDIYTSKKALRYNHGQIVDIPLMSDEEWQVNKADVMKGMYWKINSDASDTSLSSPTIHIVRSIPNIATEPIGFIKINLNSQSLVQSPIHSDEQEKIWLESPSNLLFLLKTGKLDQATMARGPQFSNDSSGQIKLEDKNYVYYTLPARLSGWNFIHAVPEESVMEGLYFNSILWVLFFLIFILLIFYTFILIRSIFGKLRMIQEVVWSPDDINTTMGSSFSLDVLINSVASLKEHRENIEWIYQKNIPILKKALCYRLLHHEEREWPDIQEQMSQLGFMFSTTLFSVILFRIDKYYDFLQTYNKEDQGLLRFFTYKMAEEIGAQSFKVLLWNSESRDIVMICNALTSVEEDLFKSKLESVVTSIVKQINSYLKITITAVISNPIQAAAHIPEGWNQVVNLMESKKYSGNNTLKCWDKDIESPVFSDMLEASRRRKEALLQAVKSNDFHKIDEELEKTKSFLESLVSYPMMFIQQLLIDYVMSIAYALMEMGSKLHVEKVFAEMHLEMQRMESIQEAIEWFKRKLSSWLEGMEEERSDQSKLISHVLEYMKANYDREISLGGIAGELQISITYLSRLFKKSIGKNFMEYLIDLRIERAKQMLMDSSLTVQLIGEKVGYINTQSFIRIFKKNVGITPGQYREAQEKECVKRLDTGKVY